MVATRFKKTQGPVQHAEKGAGRQGKRETWPKLKQVSTDSKRREPYVVYVKPLKLCKVKPYVSDDTHQTSTPRTLLAAAATALAGYPDQHQLRPTRQSRMNRQVAQSTNSEQ